MYRALPAGRPAGFQRLPRGDAERVRPAVERQDAGDPHGVAADIPRQAGDPLGLGATAGDPEPSEFTLGVRLEPERQGPPGVRAQRQQRQCDDRQPDHGARPTTTPQGSSPAGIFFRTFMVSVSTTVTSLDGPLALYSLRPSLV